MSDRELCIRRLREDPAPHLWALQDLTVFPERTRIHTRHADDPERFGYFLFSGHPSTFSARGPTLVLGGNPSSVRELLREHLPDGCWVIKATSAEHLPALQEVIPPEAKIYREVRMECDRDRFRAGTEAKAVRRMTPDDVGSLAAFFGAPPQAASEFMGWIRGARAVVGAFEDGSLASMGSTFCSIPEGWSLVAIQTAEAHRRRGLASAVVTELCRTAFRETSIVDLTVVEGNAPAIELYRTLGFEEREPRVWIDHGLGSRP